MKPGNMTCRGFFISWFFGSLLLIMNCSRSDEPLVDPGKDINALFSAVTVVPQSPDLTISLFRFFLESVTTENEYTLLLRFNKAVASASGNLSSNFLVYSNDASNTPLPVYGSLTSGDLVRVYTQTQAGGTEYRVEISNIICDGCSTQTAELKSAGVNIFKGWSFGVTEAVFQSKTQLLITFSSAVSCPVLQNTANFMLDGIVPSSTLVDGGCSTQSSSVKLNFSQAFAYGNHTLTLSETFESANSLQPATRAHNFSFANSSFYLVSALPASANSVILKFNGDLNSAGVNASDFTLANVIPDSVNVEFDYIVISSNQVTMSPDTIYMVTYKNVRTAENSASLSGKIGVVGLNTMQISSATSPDYGRFNIFSTTELDTVIASDALNFPGDCSVQSSVPDADGTVCGSAGKCIRFNHTQSLTTCNVSIANIKSSSGKSIYLSQSGSISLTLNSALAGAGQILFGGRNLEYTTPDNRVFSIKTGYLAPGNHNLTFSGFQYDGKALAQENLTVNIP